MLGSVQFIQFDHILTFKLRELSFFTLTYIIEGAAITLKCDWHGVEKKYDNIEACYGGHEVR